jgi:hypothetical protein
MTDSIHLLRPDGELVEVTVSPYEAEAHLQQLLANHPSLLPGAQVSPRDPRRWRLIRREAGIPRQEGGGDWWSTDHIFVDQDAVPTFVEVKRSSDTRIRREVVAQMLEYAANSVYWAPGTLRGWFEAQETAAGRDPVRAIADLIDPSGSGTEAVQAVEDFWNRFDTNLLDGRVRLVFVADVIPATLQRLVEFLNERLDRIEVLAVEIRQYASATHGFKALVPRVIGQTAAAQARKEPSRARAERWNEDSFTAQVTARAPAGVPGLSAILEWAHERPEITLVGGQGAKDGSMYVLLGGDAMPKHQFLALWTTTKNSAYAEVQFAIMAQQRPYNDPQKLRALYIQLKEFPSFKRDEDVLRTRGSVNLADLASTSAQKQFLAIFDAYVAEVTAAAQHENGQEDQ